MKIPDIKVVVKFTDGYQQRFTEACIKQLKQREEMNKMTKPASQISGDKTA